MGAHRVRRGGVTFGKRTARAKAWRREKCTWVAWQNQKKLFVGGGQRAGHVQRKSAAGACQVREKGPVPFPGHDLSASASPQDPPLRVRGCCFPLFRATLPYLVFQPFPHSRTSSAAPEVTRNSRAAPRQKGSAGAGERVPVTLTAPACGRERSKRLPEAAEVRPFPCLSLSECSERDSKRHSPREGCFTTL